MLDVGLDFSRKRLDFDTRLAGGELVERGAVPPDADGLADSCNDWAMQEGTGRGRVDEWRPLVKRRRRSRWRTTRSEWRTWWLEGQVRLDGQVRDHSDVRAEARRSARRPWNGGRGRGDLGGTPGGCHRRRRAVWTALEYERFVNGWPPITDHEGRERWYKSRVMERYSGPENCSPKHGRRRRQHDGARETTAVHAHR
jgi:hypothetical protein